MLMPEDIKLRVAVIVYDEDNKDIIFANTDEALVFYDDICETPGDITAAAEAANRHMERLQTEDDDEDLYDPDLD